MSHSKIMAAVMAASTLVATGAALAQAPVAASAVAAEIPNPTPDCRPEYPEAALRAQVQGVSRLAFHVDETGKVTSSEVVHSSGHSREHRLLDMAALKALAHCPIKVARDENGNPVASVVTLNYTWRLQ